MANLTGSTTAVFFVRLSAAVDEIVDVDWNTRDGTAVAGEDYESASGTVSFLPGETEKAIDVIVYGQDNVSADGKKFYIELKPPANAVLTDALAECVITVADEDGVLITSLVIAQGKRGLKGNPGLSAYEQAVLMGYTGTVEQWMAEIGDASQAADRAEGYAADSAASAATAEQKSNEAIVAVGSTKLYVDAALSDLSTAANKFYPTLAAANADIANIQVDQPVTIGESANGGLWYKATAVATSLTKSAYDSLTQAKTYADENFKPKILTTENANDLKTQGFYVAHLNVPTLANNFPSTKAGVLLANHAVTGSTGTLVSQSYFTYDGEMWIRGTDATGATYSAWQQNMTKSIVNTLIASSKNVVTLANDTDLNTIENNGDYIGYSALATSVTNMPEQSEQFFIRHLAYNQVKRQIAYARRTNKVYTRSHWGTYGWQEWEKLALDSDLVLNKSETLKDIDSKLSPLTQYTKALLTKLNGFNSVKIKLIGDSITWGANASNASTSVPRDKTLNDVRNTTDPISPSWANLFRQYIAYTFGDTSITEDRAGSAYTKRKKTISFKDNIKSFSFKSASGADVTGSTALQAITDNASAKNGEVMNLLGANFVSGRQNEFSFDITSDNASVIYATWAKGDASNIVEVYVDDVKYGEFNYYSESTVYDNEFKINFEYGKHTIRVKNIATHASSYALIQCCATEQKTWVINEGINGSATNDWLTRGLLSGSVNQYDDFIFIQLGTNDRGTKGSIIFKNRLKTIINNIDTLSSNNAKVLLLTSIPDSPENAQKPAYFYNMQIVDNVISSIAIELNLAHVSQYKHANQYMIDGTVIWADGLHPNDFGYKVMYENLRNQIFSV